VVEIAVRRRRGSDGAAAIAMLMLESSTFYSSVAPDHFAPVERDGLVEWVESDGEWLADPNNLALVAYVDDEVAGYLEASIQSPNEAARFSGNRDARETRLFVNAVVTAQRFKRRGVASRLVAAAEDWGREQGALIALCDTFLGSPESVPFWEKRMGYARRSVRLRKKLQ
jgi:GNAT superfamily N-acetyltransferase